jgi:hypothetical protein
VQLQQVVLSSYIAPECCTDATSGSNYTFISVIIWFILSP